MKLKSIEERNPSSFKNRFVATAVLVGGMALLPNCVSNTPPKSAVAAPAVAVTTSTLVSNMRNSGQGTRADVAAGDLVYQRMLASRIMDAGREAGIVETAMPLVPLVTTRQQVNVGSPIDGGNFRVSGIDSNGVDIEGMGRLEFGRPRFIGEFLLQSLVVAEPGPNGTAVIVTVTPEIKRTASERLAPTTSPAPYQTSGPVQK